MQKRQNKTLKNEQIDLADFFCSPNSARQKQYEAVRSIVIDNKSYKAVAKTFGYKRSTLYSILRDAKAGKLKLFPEVTHGPTERRINDKIRNKIFAYRKKGLSTIDIEKLLSSESIKISARTIERILKDAGIKRLKKRTNKELGKTTKNAIIPKRAEHLDFSKLQPFKIDVPVAGIFFFIPYILESNILNIVKECKLPESNDISNVQAALSMLFFKLIGGQRLSHMGDYDQEPGLALFSGLNILPKATYMSTYSCRCSSDNLLNLQSKIVSCFKKKYPEFYSGEFINLDFHSIPHYGDESQMEKIWCGARGKALKGATSIIAQDAKNNTILYTRADILRREEAQEIKKFVNYWKKLKGPLTETLVFDCKFTTYGVLDELENDGIKFITLRKRSESLIKKALAIPKEKWSKVHLNIPKRKHKYISVYEEEVKLRKCKNEFRQIIIKDHGRSKPTFILTNNKDLLVKTVLEVYAKRWRVENKIAELVAFFNLNALSSPIMIRIQFDILWTMLADTLYHLFAADLRRFEKTLAPQLFKKFINMPGHIEYNGNNFLIKIRKRAHTPILKDVEKLKNSFQVPWLDNKTMEIIWTA
jgi:transposase